jgi:hypothetical protein
MYVYGQCAHAYGGRCTRSQLPIATHQLSLIEAQILGTFKIPRRQERALCLTKRDRRVRGTSEMSAVGVGVVCG